MDAVKFLQERNRMYESGAATPGIGLEDDYDPVIAVKVVEQWSAAHPRKTRQSVFLEQWPDARTYGNGILCLCPKEISSWRRGQYGECINGGNGCDSCRREFWGQEVE